MWESVFGWLPIGAGLLAATLWLVASLVKLPRYPTMTADLDRDAFAPTWGSLRRVASLNAWAAGVTAGAALLQAASLAAHQLGR